MKFEVFKKHFQYTPYFTTSSLKSLGEHPHTIRNELVLWEKRGLIMRLKRGVYTLSDMERRVPLNTMVLASHMVAPSYISLEWALSYYSLIPEQAGVITSVTTRKTQYYDTPVGTFYYHHAKIPLFTGFTEHQTEDGFRYFLALPEKSVVDFLYFHLSEIQPRTATEQFEVSFRFQHLDSLDWEKVRVYAGLSASKKLMRIVQLLEQWVKATTEETL